MRKLRNYFRSVFLSASDPTYYFTLLSRPFHFSVLFFIVGLALTTVLTSVGWRLFVWPDFLTSLSHESAELIAQLPENSQFEYANGRFQTQNLPEPFFIRSTQTLRDWGFGERIIALTSQEQALPAALTLSSSSAYLMTDTQADHVLYHDLFEDDVQFAMNREDISTFIQAQITHLSDLDAILIGLFFIANFLGSLFIGVLMIVFFSLIIQSLGWLLGQRLSYTQAFRWGLHLYPIAFFIDQLSLILASQSHFPIVSFAYVGMSLLILWSGKPKKMELKK